MNDSRLALVVLAPLLGAVLSYLFGKTSQKIAGVIASAAVIASFACVVSLWSDLPTANSFVATLSSWLSFGGFSFPLELYFDKLSAVMCLVVTGIGALIHIYSIGYMSDDESRPRFFAYLNLFIASMLVLVLGKSLPTIFIGWEGVGLCSYLLIGFWYTNPDFAKAGRKAFVMNRIGDVGFLVAMAVLYHSCGTLDIVALKDPRLLAAISGDLGFIAGLALFVAATGKSAQLPLFTWLPDAMAGPTPVSALIHAATMVTAGVYLMARMSGVVGLDAAVPAIILWTALATSLIAAIIAMSQNDIKKVLAYSTVSQLGFMFIAVGVGAYGYALFHVVTHAFFKACLFLSAGSVIHGCHHEQDMRHMGGLARFMPLTCFAYGVSTVAIAGIPPLSGYFSKHGILDSIPLSQNIYLQPWLGMIGMVATGITILTAFYMCRSFIMTFMGAYRGHEHPHEAPLVMTAPVLVLAVLSVVGGAFLSPVFLSYLVGPLPKMAEPSASHGGPVSILVGSLPAMLGLGLAFWLYLGSVMAKDFLRKVFLPIEKLSEGKFFVDEVYDLSIVGPLQKVSRVSFKTLDQSFFVGSGEAIGKISRAVGELTARMTTGQVGTYIMMMFCAVAFLVYVFLPVR